MRYSRDVIIDVRDLDACPFCGRPAMIDVRSRDESANGFDIEMRIICWHPECPCKPSTRWIRCYDYDARYKSRISVLREEDQKRLARNWNRRREPRNEETRTRSTTDVMYSEPGRYDFFTNEDCTLTDNVSECDGEEEGLLSFDEPIPYNITNSGANAVYAVRCSQYDADDEVNPVEESTGI